MDIKELFTVTRDEDLADLGFIHEGLLVEDKGYEHFFYRLRKWHNTELGIDILAADTGNGHCGVVSVKPSTEEWPTYDDTIFVKTLKNGLILKIESIYENQQHWDFNLWRPDEKNPKELGSFHSGGTIDKSECHDIIDAYAWIKHYYDTWGEEYLDRK